MQRSVMVGYKKTSLFAAVIVTALSYSFVADTEWLSWSNQCLMRSYDQSADIKLKKLDLQVTDDSFIRLRKTYQNGKQEYFSLQLHLLDEMAYLGTAYAGTLQLRTKEDDVIVQTYNDRKGNVDSMASVLNIPLKNIEPERLDSLQRALAYFKAKGL